MEYHDWLVKTFGPNFRAMYGDESLNLASMAWDAATKNTSPNTSEPGDTAPPQICPSWRKGYACCFSDTVQRFCGDKPCR